MKRIAIIHYASPPIIGGVESTIAYHARGLAQLGYFVRVISGEGSTFDDRVECIIDPLLSSTHPDVLKVKAELDSGSVTSAFWTLVDKLRLILNDVLADCDICIAHNIPTLHKNMALSMALLSPNSGHQIPIIGWCHDLAWTNEQYASNLHSGIPWNILRERSPNTQYVTISETRQIELANLFGILPDQIKVIVPGIDPERFFRWTSTMKLLNDKLNLLNADGILLLPARITRRKNIEMGIQILHQLREQTGQDFRLIVTGPPGPHNPSNLDYLGTLQTLRETLALETAVHFLYENGRDGKPLAPDEDTITNLYQIADGLLFPSTQEGFGIPVLEAGLVGLPVFCSNIHPLQSTGMDDVIYFDPVNGAPDLIAKEIASTLQLNPQYRLRVRVRQRYRWDIIIQNQLVPLLEAT